MTWEDFFQIIKHSLTDTVRILPVIFVVYVIIEVIESRESSQGKFKRLLSGKPAPFFGALIGMIPQCGFSVVATKLFQKEYILVGTLVAVYFATSDEAVPILFSMAINDPSMWVKLLLLMAIKFVYGMGVGFILNRICKRDLSPIEESDHIFIEEEGCCHHEINEERKSFFHFISHPLLHSLKICLYILVIDLVFGIVFEGLIGEEKIAEFLSGAVFFQPLFSTLIGLIPNCASSVILAQLYAKGVVTLGGAIAGLTINSGLGLAVLLKDGKNLRSNLKIVGLMVGLTLLLGYLITIIEVLIG